MKTEDIGNDIIKIGSNINRLIAELTSEINKLDDSRTWIVDNSNFLISEFKDTMVTYSQYYGNIYKYGNDIINYAKGLALPISNYHPVYLESSEETKYKQNSIISNDFKEGDLVKIINGKYEGIIGTIEKVNNNEVSVKIPGLLTSFLVDVLITQIEKK